MATRKELAEHLGLSPQSINDLIRNNVITIGSGRSPVNIDACRLQYLNYLRKAARYTKKDGTADIAEEKARLTKAQADKAELEVSELEAKLIPAELVAKRISAPCLNWQAPPILNCAIKRLLELSQKFI